MLNSSSRGTRGGSYQGYNLRLQLRASLLHVLDGGANCFQFFALCNDFNLSFPQLFTKCCKLSVQSSDSFTLGFYLRIGCFELKMATINVGSAE
jgi:hypothetical protein